MKVTDEAKDKRYIKEIIKEYNVRFDSWGASEFWDLDHFRTLERMVFESTHISINANTFKRFFQQRTGNPQLATRDALCRFLGYTGYSDFVIQKTRQEFVPAPVPIGEVKREAEMTVENQKRITPHTAVPDKRTNRPYAYLIIVLLLFICGYLLYAFKINEVYADYLCSKIRFNAVNTRGTAPLTVSFSYDIPSAILKDITFVYEESNGEITKKKPVNAKGQVNATYIYDGDGYCHLQYKGENLKTITIESRKPGWSVFARNERKGIFSTMPIGNAYRKEGYVSLPLDSVLPEARPGHLFVSYVYFKEQLVDGDNFMVEARVRNAKEDHAIPVSDAIMYLSSEKGRHGFALNEAGYAYIKFISSEKTVKGDDYNLSKFKFNAAKWHVLGMKVQGKHSDFYVDGQKVFSMNYQQSIGMANELILRFKGCGAVDYVRVFNAEGKLVYEEDFKRPLL